MTIDFSATGDDLALRVSNEWGDLNRESRQHQTIRQSGTVPGRRTSVPVKSRSIRAGAPPAPARRWRRPMRPTTNCSK